MFPQKSDFNPTELFSSSQKDWEILPFPQVVDEPQKPQDCFILAYWVGGSEKLKT